MLKVRAVFSDVGLRRLSETDHPIVARDAETNIHLCYRSDAQAGWKLTLTGGALGNHAVSVGCDVADVNLVTMLLLDGTKFSGPSPKSW